MCPRGAMRMEGWNYNSPATYFITIRTNYSGLEFSRIVRRSAMLTEAGEIVNRSWLDTPSLRKDLSVKLDDFVIMPDHFHGIISIGDNAFCQSDRQQFIYSGEPFYNEFGVQSKNLSSIIRGFKATCTSQIIKIGHEEFQWQSRFYERMIRSYPELVAYRKYIQMNPERWEHV